MFAKRYQYYDCYCLLSPAICGYNFPGSWIFAIHFENFTAVYLTSSISPLVSFPVITTILLHQSALSFPSPHFSRPFPRYSIKQSGPIKRRGKKKISIASRGELAFSIWPPGDRPGNKPRRFFDRQIITLERSPKEGGRLLVTCWKKYIRSWKLSTDSR